ncbi:MAG: riboflavin synthase [Bacteroidetes bacterium]|nr:riboflavin synthase [Bacteroidota bacterium]MBS1539770.1 riboflavin synthase [Bacteroidota bacterium]
MFTGIIESVGKIISIQKEGSNKQFKIASPISHELRIDQSVSHQGVCLTVISVGEGFHAVVAVEETLKKSNFDLLQENDLVNLERSMVANGRFDGHIVQGHVDQTAIVEKIADQNGSWLIDFSFDAMTGNLTIEKGSIAVNGVSLTCFNSVPGRFSVALIPYTFEHTAFNQLKEGHTVNLEFDVVGKYIKQILAQKI